MIAKLETKQSNSMHRAIWEIEQESWKSPIYWTSAAILMLVLPVRNMLMSRTVSIFLCQTKINDIDLIIMIAETNFVQQTKFTSITEKNSIGNGNIRTWLARRPKPMRKLSGLISRCKNDFEWTNSTRLIWENN